MTGRRSSIRPPQPIGHALRQLARWAIAGSLGAASCCGSDFEGWDPVSCDDASNVLRNPSFARDRDYFGILRDINSVGQAGRAQATYIQQLGQSGEPCKSAPDADACMVAFDAATKVRDACLENKQCGIFAVVTQGDLVTQFVDREQLVSWLSPIDTLSDALALSAWDGKQIQCATANERGTRYEHDEDRYLFGTEWEDCGVQVQYDTWEVSESGSTTKTETEKLGDSGCAVGRRPEGLCPIDRRVAAGTLGAHFAEIAHLEAASVYAFERLARELVSFGAPRNLVARAASSALEEVQHARVMGAFARSYGAEPYQVRIANLPARSLYQLALENAVEGCIHETYGALIAHHQAAHAAAPALRSAMRTIARDETNHAELAWQIAAWVTPHLTETQRTELRQAQTQALLSLSQARPALPPLAAASIGIPNPILARALVQQLATLALSPQTV
jgi:hypothetical protein